MTPKGPCNHCHDCSCSGNTGTLAHDTQPLALLLRLTLASSDLLKQTRLKTCIQNLWLSDLGKVQLSKKSHGISFLHINSIFLHPAINYIFHEGGSALATQHKHAVTMRYLHIMHKRGRYFKHHLCSLSTPAGTASCIARALSAPFTKVSVHLGIFGHKP